MDFDPTELSGLGLPNKVWEVWLFGSHARGTRDSGSDIDVLVVVADEGDLELVETLRRSIPESATAVDFSTYTLEGIESILEPPSLFALHLKLEGVELLSRNGWLKTRLTSLQPYRHHHRDLATLRDLLRDIVESLTLDDLSGEYDTGVLGTVVRNAGIVLSDHLGRPDFSPWAPLRLQGGSHLCCPLSEAEYEALVTSRRASERGSHGPAVDYKSLLSLCERIQAWLDRSLEVVPVA